MPSNERFHPIRVSMKISVIYIVVGALWILLSDKMLAALVGDKETFSFLGMIKGWIYVAVTGVIIYGLVYSVLRKLKSYQDRLHHNAYFDSLTGMPNRLSLYEDVSLRLQERSLERAALLFLDVDNFKYINDSLGHSYGDRLVAAIGERLTGLVLENRPIYRLSGDQLVIWLEPYRDEEQLKQLLHNIMNSCLKPFDLDGSSIHTSLSIGVSYYPEHGSDVDQLLRTGDLAMYQAKKAGGNQYACYEPAMNDSLVVRMNIEKHLRTALANNEFQLHYQPQYDSRQRRIVGFEALLRWNNPTLGYITPDRFIPVAEDTHLIIPIGEWVLQSACQFISRLRKQTGKSFGISVNLSVLQLTQDNFTEIVEQSAAAADLPLDALELEITESIFMESVDLITSKLKKLRSKGVRIALDDFGKGYSSLNCLLSLPITTIKIDKSFIDSIVSDQTYLSIAQHIISIGRTLGLDVVAEGVETEEQLRYLNDHHCHFIQGYLFSKPLPQAGVIALLDESKQFAE